MEIVPFAEEHVDAAAELLAARHKRHREHEPLLPDGVDFRAQVEREWTVEGASGVISPHGYLFGAPGRHGWFSVGIAGHAVAGEPEHARDLYAAAAGKWVEAGHSSQMVFVPASDRDLVDAWFRLSFGASGVLALRETAADEPFDAGIEIRQGTRHDYPEAARLELEMARSMQPSPSFSGIELPSAEELLREEWLDGDDAEIELFLAERDDRVVGHIVLYRRPPDLRVRPGSIDLAQASTEPVARGTGVGRALTAHVIRWAYEQGYEVMTTDWRMTNLWASRFWPKRGFRPAFLRLYRSIP
ncbi:MAG TPA: GNAT family N-acetyltransferase [Gaiellaceae bacterium]|nr:GNAT family N-acetyltransferase [Gaiellaceae bacterium]